MRQPGSQRRRIDDNDGARLSPPLLHKKHVSVIVYSKRDRMRIIDSIIVFGSSAPKMDLFLRSGQRCVFFALLALAVIAMFGDGKIEALAFTTSTSMKPVKQLKNVMRLQSHLSRGEPGLGPSERSFGVSSRRRWLKGLGSAAKLVAASSTINLVLPTKASQASDTATTSSLAAIQDAADTLQKLLDNWKKAVVDCTYADVPRELLSQENKQELLEKASTFALFDKSVSVVSCKTNNRVVRDYLGTTAKGPLVGLDKQLRRALDEYEIEDLDTYVQVLEDVQQALAKADSFSYSASSDFSALNNFQEEDATKILSGNSNLQECRSCIQSAVEGLNRIIKILNSSAAA